MHRRTAAAERAATHHGGPGQRQGRESMQHSATAEAGVAATPMVALTPYTLRHRILGGGGFTIDARRGKDLRRGIAVGAEPSASLVLPADAWDDEHVRRWLRRCDRHLRQHHGGEPLHVGGWLDQRLRQAHLDLVRVFPGQRRLEAFDLARRLHQRAVYDLDAGRLVVVADVLASMA